MRRIVVVSTLVLTGTAFLVSGMIGLSRAPASMGVGLKATIIASAIAFLLTVMVCVLVAWPEKRRRK